MGHHPPRQLSSRFTQIKSCKGDRDANFLGGGAQEPTLERELKYLKPACEGRRSGIYGTSRDLGCCRDVQSRITKAIGHCEV